MNIPPILRALLLSLLASASPAFSTPPLFDKVEIAGQRGNLHQKGKGWLALPPSEKLGEYILAERCSAIGGPRGKYLVEDGKLWLYGLYRCGGDIDIKAVYPQQDVPILATWVTGSLLAEVGNTVCMSTKGWFYIYETETTMQVEGGIVKSTESVSNAEHPDCRNKAQ